MQITRRLEFDAGHRLPNHKSQCRHLHGHRYAIEITVEADVVANKGSSDEGMVMDFSDVKSIAQQVLVDRWDHAFLAHRDDKPVVDFLAGIKDHKTVLLDAVPTAENLAHIAFGILRDAYRDQCGGRIKLNRVRLYETPNCWADALA
jgi:6-pyruvoyltetrahydropterin/6-carboxytetrahydropterin synthase